jgi:hypothetical protein
VSFLTIGVIWLNHHRVFEQVSRTDGLLLLLNLNLLLWTALIPFPTAVAEHLGVGGEVARTASALYSGVLLLMALSFSGLFAWVTHTDRLLDRLPSPNTLPGLPRPPDWTFWIPSGSTSGGLGREDFQSRSPGMAQCNRPG